METKRAFFISIFVVLLGMMSSAVVFAQANKTDISVAEITAADQVYIGTEVEPEITVRVNGTTLKPNMDYDVSYGYNPDLTNANIVSFTIIGIGN